MTTQTHDARVVSVNQILSTGFDDYCDAFATITQRARQRFEQRDWGGMRRDVLERLDLYVKVVDETVGMVARHLGTEAHRPAMWKDIKSEFHQMVLDNPHAELACTFYNSVSRKILRAVGFDPELGFVGPPPGSTPPPDVPELFHTWNVAAITPETIREILLRYGFRTPFAHIDEDASLCSQRLAIRVSEGDASSGPICIEMLGSPFFRGMSAYLVGRVRWNRKVIPLVFALDNRRNGLRVDAVLSHDDDLRVLFSFTRAYFHVDVPNPFPLVTFLKQLMPEKRLAEVYIGLGYHKHGKTELYRDLLFHQKVCSQDLFDFSPGKRGMVMIAFNMPQDDLIYKLIRDRFDSPKQTSARQVMEKYDYVFKHDRVGRLVDVQTFENLELEDCCFTSRLLSEIRTEAKKAASLDCGHVILHHAYVERRVTPLDVFIVEADAAAAEAAVIDYGQAIKDLARVNVFPGDLLTKNFGVTNLGRVVFYDYDELCPLTDCNFRKIPKARNYEDEMSAEPWFNVGEDDVFPEEFASFLGFPPDLRAVFLHHHGNLFAPEFWRRTQGQILDGVTCHIRPYSDAQRLRPRSFGNGTG